MECSFRTMVTVTVILVLVLGFGTEMGSCKVVQFIFGDSLSDVGNNKYLPRSLAQASLPWYGIDYGDGLPNGRFTNGRTVADLIGDQMGLPRPPAFLNPDVDEKVVLENGLNYASGGGGILNETGQWFIQKFSLYKQIELFQGTQELITKKIGTQAANKLFAEAHYVVALGSNDFINNYLQPVYADSWKYTSTSFINYLMSTLQDQLKLFYKLGARQLVFFGLGPMGCIPLQRVLSSSGECQEKTNQLAISFNKAANNILANLSRSLPNASFRFGDAYDVVEDVIYNPQKHGFNNSDSPCCSFGENIRPALTCVPASVLCQDRSKYVFWDEFHPSDRANEIIANEIISKLGFLRPNATDVPAAAPAPSPAFGQTIKQ
ncbi:GDSL esterase/lipase At1g74460-like isoform X1 [Aristolochia californica]|uniref:GDSL esterase/lipase At1g74460-like isoform X1 n=1 Tax=Aristolochia californica TaxID=171875 RepID=UPI0035DF30A1